MGITVSIDDFGTGYSTFSYIKELPADTIKIDMSFVRDIHLNEDSQGNCQGYSNFSGYGGPERHCGRHRIRRAGNYIKDLGCREGQGYYYSKPTSAGDCEQFMIKL